MSSHSHFRTRALLFALSAILASTSQLAQAFHVESGTACSTVGAACSYLSNDLSAGGQNSTQVNGFCGPDMTCASNGAKCTADAQCFNYCGTGICGGQDALCNSRDAFAPKQSKITCAPGFTCSSDGDTGTCGTQQPKSASATPAASGPMTSTVVVTLPTATSTFNMPSPMNMNPQMPSASSVPPYTDATPALAVPATQSGDSNQQEPCDDAQTPVVSTEEPCDEDTSAGTAATSNPSDSTPQTTPSKSVPLDSSNPVVGMNVPAGSDVIKQAASQVADMDIPANMDPNPCDEKPKPSQSHHNHKHDKDHKKNGRRNDKKRLALEAAIEARQVRARDLRPRFTPIVPK